MTYHEILKRFTGFTCPIFGLQWNASPSEVEAAEEVVGDLENRSLLFEPVQLEEGDRYVQAVGELRDRLEEPLTDLEYQSPLDNQIRKMRRASRRFVEQVGHSGLDAFAEPVRQSLLRRELHRLRDQFGEALAEISISHGVEVDDELASIIPFNNFTG